MEELICEMTMTKGVKERSSNALGVNLCVEVEVFIPGGQAIPTADKNIVPLDNNNNNNKQQNYPPFLE